MIKRLLWISFFWFFACYARSITIPFELLLSDPVRYNVTRSKPWMIDCIAYGQKSRGKESSKELAKLFFGKCDFAAQQAHYNQQPNLQFPFATECLSPRLSFCQKGLVATLSYQYDCSDSDWAVGLEVLVPWQEILIKKKKSSNVSGSSLFGGQTIDDVFLTDNSEGIDDFAINMGFALTLPTQAQGLGLQVPLINLENQAYGNQPTIGAVLMTENLFAQIDQNPVTILDSSQKPTPPFFIDVGLGSNPSPDSARGLQALDENGAVGGVPLLQGEHARFVSTVDYGSLGLQKNLLSRFWLVPSATVLPVSMLTNRASIVGRQLKSLLKMLTKTPEQEFEEATLSFDDSKQRGLGDIGLKLYALYRWTDDSAVQCAGGFLVPSGGSFDKRRTANLFAVSKGSNGHLQPFLQANFIHTVTDWFSYFMGLSLTYALPASEYIPASFVGAIVKNCGPVTKADISWMTSLWRAGFSFFIPFISDYKPYVSVSYQFYYKSNDHVSFIFNNGYDWAGNFYPLSDIVARKNSNKAAHIGLVQGGIRLCSYGTLECGWQGVVGGFNTALSNGWTVRLNLIF